MNTDNFEKRLRSVPLRRIPPEWREEILDAAQGAARPQRPTTDIRLAAWWRSLLWPSPTAWAGVAAAWVLVVALNWAQAPGGAASARPGATTVALDLRMVLALQRELEAALGGAGAVSDAEPPKPQPTVRPRSERSLSSSKIYA